DGRGVKRTRGKAEAPDAAPVRAVERVIERLNAVMTAYRTVSSYIYSFVATNSRDTLAQARQSELQRQGVRLAQLRARFTAWVGTLDVETLIARSAIAQAHAFMLHEAQTLARHQMSPAEEALAAELNVTGGAAWGKLHGVITSQLTLTLTLPEDKSVSKGRNGAKGGPASQEQSAITMSMARNLAYDRDREARRRAYKAELACWESNAAPLAAALNGVKGQVNTLTQRRGWPSALDAALFDARIDRATLDAMLTAARESFPDFRRYLHAKARALGLPRLAWYDISAPVGSNGREWSFGQAEEFILSQFATYSPSLHDLAARAFRERWIDAEPRPGKEDGAFCMPVRGDESRVMSNFKPGFGGVSTLAHELGHAYHNQRLASLPMLQRETPMTLAETASIFCETIVRHAALRVADAEDRLEILEAYLQGACQVVVDITSRFLFEQAVFERRLQRELAIDEFCELMLDAQRATYGDGLDDAQLHPYMWAVKSHYYSAGRSFYNFPYMFGLLFGLGLYARYQRDPAAFTASYDDLLASTGQADTATLAARFGFDLHTPDFWRGSLDLVRADIAQFVALVGDVDICAEKA
ncbi:MAG TPA: M3 family oligoendopeptidase, partial [Ktedonobacterales bacterium]|nr:M3 family oligoendopeptidase [Ktedonobacterales bacterium]